MLLCLSSVNATAEEYLTGEARRPFPLLMPLDYPACRASAWLDALHGAIDKLPAGSAQTIASLGFNVKMGQMALSSLLFPLDVATSQYLSADTIKVYLKIPVDLRENMAAILASPERLAFRMLLVQETISCLGELGAAWPKNLGPGNVDYPFLENIIRKLEALWLILESETSDTLEKALSMYPESLALVFLQADNLVENDRFSSDAALFEKLSGLLARKAPMLDEALRESLHGFVIYLEGLNHLRAGRYALAESCFGELKKNQPFLKIFSGQAKDVLLGHAGLMRQKGKDAEMCADLTAACSLGDCHPLFEARLRGFCLGKRL